MHFFDVWQCLICLLYTMASGDPASIGYEDPVTDKRSTLVDTVMIDLRNKLYELGKLKCLLK